jgi:glutathione S-transferase
MAVTFYYGSGSPYAWKVWLVLEHKAIPYELKLLSFDRGDTKAPAFRALNPRGTVPTITDGAMTLWESNAIVEYLEERYREKPLLPADLAARAKVRRIMAEADNYLAPAVGKLFDATLYAKEPVSAAALAEVHSQLIQELERYDALLTGDYLAGPLSLADFAVFSHARLVRRIDDRQPKNGLGDRMPKKLAAWMKRIEALPYYAKTVPPHWKS